MPVTLHPTIREIAGEWDALAGGNPFATRAWLATVEASWRFPVEPLYFALRLDGALAAGAVCYIARPTNQAETLDDLVFGRALPLAHAIHATFLPAMICGPALGYGWHVGTAAHLTADEAGQARSAVLDAMEREADARGLRLAFVQVLDEESEVRRLLGARSYLRCRNVPISVLDLKWRSFDEYLGSLPRKHATEFQRQINRSRDAGNVVERLASADGVAPRLAELLDGNARKYSGRPFAAGEKFFPELIRNSGTGAAVFTIRRANGVAAACVVLAASAAGAAVAVGVDSEADSDYAYFQAAYNAPIAYAIERGIERLYFGRELYEVKLRRGCRLTNAWIYSNQSGARRGAAALWYALASRWNRWKLPDEVRVRLP